MLWCKIDKIRKANIINTIKGKTRTELYNNIFSNIDKQLLIRI